MTNPFDARRDLLGAATKFILEAPKSPEPAPFEPPRLTLAALEKIKMSRSRDRILANLEEMYTDASYRAVKPMALTIKHTDGLSELTPFEIDYARYNDPRTNAFFRDVLGDPAAK